jgi:hypothetical protein
MVITARCDAAHAKTNIFNYVPLVPLEHWLLRDGITLVAKRTAAAAQGDLKTILADAGMSPSILTTISLEDIDAELHRGTSKPEKGIAARFSKALASVRSCDPVLEGDANDDEQRLSFLVAHERVCGGVMKDLLSNNIADYHFLDRVDAEVEGHGYVILLREIRLLSADMAKRVASGLERGDYETVIATDAESGDRLMFPNSDDFALPLAVVESPFIELIMQRLTQLFARIGVADLPSERIQSLKSILGTLRKDSQ